jgi:predicted Zn-dependent peptidase
LKAQISKIESKDAETTHMKQFKTMVSPGRLLTMAWVLMALLVLPAQSQAQKSKLKEQNKYKLVTNTSADGKYSYMSVIGDPLNARIYVLKNGLTVYLTANASEPRIFTSVAVRTGSTNDPKDATGLAHYLEHLLFKGTDKYGSLDYSKEKPLLDKIEALYEQYRVTKDEAKRKEIYREIDATSQEAAKFAIANEYDKMLAAIGAKGTNAYTSWEQTVYINDIPSNQLDKWLRIEGERFRNPVLRLFHTELEAVYEEKNISLDNDQRKAFQQLFEGVFPTHNYGQQTTIGTVEHLKNPSITKIKDYFRAYYVPNNMAICLSGDLDPDATIALIDKYFGAYQPQSVTPYNGPEEKPIQGVKSFEVTGPDAEILYIGFRTPGNGKREALVVEIIDYLLSNSSAGLIDLNLVKQQKVLQAYSSVISMRDYGVHMLGGSPKEGQKLEELRDLLLAELARIKKGEFDASLLTAVINDMEINRMRAFEQNRNRASEFVDAFIMGEDWSDHVKEIDEMRTITVEEIKAVASKLYGNNYVVVYKRNGERKEVAKVVKPEITPVPVNRDAQSDFLKQLVNTPAPDVRPRFIDYSKDIVKGSLASKTPLHYVHNTENSLFTLYYLFDFGTNHDKEMAMAVSYLPFLGTDKYSAEEISKKFYALGTTFSVNTGDDQVYVYVSGLEKNFDESLELFEHLLANAKADPAALQSLVERQLKTRTDAKLNKNQILWRGMMNYGQYGQRNPFNDVLSEADLRKLSAEQLAARLRGLTSYKHRVLYYGPWTLDKVQTSLDKFHKAPASFKELPQAAPYTWMTSEKPKVYFVNYDMVQAEILWLSKSVNYDYRLTPAVRIFNEYYGGSMSSIVFQTIRESKALAYSTFSSFTTPRNASDPFFVQAYVGTQADKLHEAIAGMQELLDGMTKSENLFEGAKAALRNKIETERIIRTGILFDLEAAMRRGVDHDLRQDVYNQLSNMSFADVEKFHKDYVAGKQYNLLILGSKEKIDLKSLAKYGEVVELSLQDLFGY